MWYTYSLILPNDSSESQLYEFFRIINYIVFSRNSSLVARRYQKSVYLYYDFLPPCHKRNTFKYFSITLVCMCRIIPNILFSGFRPIIETIMFYVIFKALFISSFCRECHYLLIRQNYQWHSYFKYELQYLSIFQYSCLGSLLNSLIIVSPEQVPPISIQVLPQ